MKTYSPYLDGWRGIAISCVLVGHFLPVRGIDLGALGVNFFFVLSGLLMARLLFIQQTPLPTFYRRRGSRILPAAIVFIAAATALVDVDGPQLLAALTFTTNYVRMPPDLQHLWSLSVEEHSYVLLSLLAIATRAGLVSSRLAVGSAATGVGAITLIYAAGTSGPVPSTHTEVASFGILASAFLAVTLRGGGRVPAVAIVALIGAGAATHWWSVPLSVRIIGGLTMFALAVNLLARSPRLHGAFGTLPLRMLGTWSFSVYLWQQLFYVAANADMMPRSIGLLASIAVGSLSFYFIEQPARRYLNRLASPGQAPISLH